MLSAALALMPPVVEGAAVVVDGDTLRIGSQRIRLAGIDAPESQQTCQRADDPAWPCGRDATRALESLIAGRPLRCEITGTDRYSRLIGTCHLDDLDINGWMVTSGWAVAYRAYSSLYIANEAAARGAGRGLWSTEFALPSAWRAAHRR
jgi:endonuclease YncB( thermonuclease family)